MKRTVVIVILLCALCNAGFTQMSCPMPMPENDGPARAAVVFRPEVHPLVLQYSGIVRKRLLALNLSDVARIFGPKLETATNWWGYGGNPSGPKLDHYPADLVAPLVASRSITILSGHYGHPAKDKSHTDLHAIGDIGYLVFFYDLDGESIQTACI